jgi:hypothetical protein
MPVMTLSGASPTLWRWSRLATSRLCDCQHWRRWRGCGRWSAVARPSWHGGPCRASSHGARRASLLLRDDRMLRSFRRGNCAWTPRPPGGNDAPRRLARHLVRIANDRGPPRCGRRAPRRYDLPGAAPRRGRLSRRGVYQLDPSFSARNGSSWAAASRRHSIS